MLFYRKVTILMVGLDNAGKTSTVADLTGGSFSINFFFNDKLILLLIVRKLSFLCR